MRRPSLGVQQNDDDLSRLASSPVDNITFSTARTSSSSSSNSSALNRGEEERLDVSYLPKIIELEWQHQQQQNQQQQQQLQNHRKRKERLDSTSSNSQTDRKVGRSSNNEQQQQHVLVENVVTQVANAESLGLTHQNSSQQSLTEEKANHHQPSPVKSHYPHLLLHNLSSVSHHQYQSQHKKVASGSGGSGATLSYVAWNNNVSGDDHYSDGEHERRRSSERFCRSRAPHGRKSSSCSSAKKFSSSGSSSAGGRVTKGGGGPLRQQNAEVDRRGFVSGEPQRSKKQQQKEDEIKDTVCATPRNIMEVVEETKMSSAPLPWNECPDETPVVCPRFADNTFDHVMNVSHKFEKGSPPPSSKKEIISSNKYVNNENLKTRSIMRKYGSGNGGQNNNAYTKNRNGDLRLMIITPDERMKQISGRLSRLKKRMLMYEEGFERDFGHKPDKLDTMSDKAMKTIMTEIQKLKRERQAIKTNEFGGGGGGLVTPIVGGGASGGGSAASMFGKMDDGHQDSLSGDLKTSQFQETLTDIEMVSLVEFIGGLWISKNKAILW